MKEKVDPVVAASQAFLKRFGEDSGKRLPDILPAIGIQLHYRDANSYEGALLRIKGVPRGYVVLSRKIRENTRMRFTLAHEIGHYILPNQQELSQPCGKAEIESWDELLNKPELDANQFAAEVLMPRSVVLPYLRESPRLTHIEQIARACDTSLTASAFRLVDLSSFRVAMVWSQDGRVRWYRASSEFVRWVRKGHLNRDSFAFDLFDGRIAPSSYESVPASAWLFDKGLRSEARILEHSIPLPGYGAVLTLLLISEPIEEEDDSGASLVELDPNDFTLRRAKWQGRR